MPASLNFPPFVNDARFVAASKNSPPMREGSHGNHVRLLQGSLIDLGAKMPRSTRATGRPDGIFGYETRLAVQAFQLLHVSDFKLSSDGVAGRDTLLCLDKLMLKSQSANVSKPGFNMFPHPFSKEYMPGTGDPALQSDPGAGKWNSQPKTMLAQAQLAGIFSVMPAANFIIGDDAVKHLWHYFGNSGSPLRIDAEGMVKEVPSAWKVYEAEVAQAKDFAERLPPGQHHIASKKTNAGYNQQSENKNWFFAVGGYVAWGKGLADIPPGPDSLLSLDFEYHVFDRYNWDNGKAVNIHGVVITDHFMGEFHRQGLAQEFDEVGSFKRRFQWRRGHAIPKNQY